MVDPAKIRSAVDAYIKAFDDENVDAIMALYADECSVEDPVGTEPVRGAAAVREFYARSLGAKPKLTLQPPVRIAGNEAAFAFTGIVTLPEGKMQFDVIDHMVFDDNGLIRQMRAFFGPENFRPYAG